jgi:hypothetical protein
MISVNISTIKQYFWYFDNFNKTYKIGHKYILPILKVKDKYYVFHNKKLPLFDELTLCSMKFVTYDKQYSYKVIDELTKEEDIILEFNDYICVFITVDDNLKWTIQKSHLLSGNEFYEQSLKDEEMIVFNFVIKKKPSKEIFSSSCTSSSTSISPIDELVRPLSPECSAQQILQEVTNNYVGDCVDTYSGIPDPFWDDVVLVDRNPLDF